MRAFKWWLIGVFTVLAGTAYGLKVYGELEGALLEKLSSDPTGTEARVYYNTTENKAKLYNGTSWGNLGGSSGAGEINYVLSPSSIDGWDEIGAGITASTTTTESNFPRIGIDESAIFLGNDGGGTSGFSYCLQVGEADKNKKLKIEWAQKVGTYTSGDFTYRIVSDTASDCSGTETDIVLHSTGTTGAADIPDQNGVMYDEFDADDSDYYEFFFERTGGSGGNGIYVSGLTIGPGKLHSGAVVTAWQASSTPSTYTGFTVNTQTEWWRRVGDTIEVRGEMTGVSAGGSPGEMNITGAPEGLTFKTQSTTAFPVGTVLANNSSIQRAPGIIAFNNSNGLYFISTVDDQDVVGTTNSIWNASTNIPFTWSTDFLRYEYSVEIQEWQGSGVLNTITQDNLTEWQTVDAEDYLNNTSGSFDLGSMRWRRVGDSMEINVKERSNAATGSGNVLLTIPGGFSMPASNNQFTQGSGWFFDDSSSSMEGIWPAYDSSTTIRFNFRGAGGVDVLDWTQFNDNDVISAHIIVPITEWAGSQSSLVGFSAANANQSGFVSVVEQTFSGRKNFNGMVAFKRQANLSTAAGDLNVEGLQAVRINTGSTATITGFSGGVRGQVIYMFKVTGGHTTTIEHNGAGTQPVRTKDGSDIVQPSIGPIGSFYCDGSSWYEM